MTGHIENSERGITVDKSLAWTIGGSLVAVGLYIGVTVATLSTTIDNLQSTIAVLNNADQNATRDRVNLESRLRILENGAAASRAEFVALAASLQGIVTEQREIKTDQREIYELLRQSLNQPEARP